MSYAPNIYYDGVGLVQLMYIFGLIVYELWYIPQPIFVIINAHIKKSHSGLAVYPMVVAILGGLVDVAFTLGWFGSPSFSFFNANGCTTINYSDYSYGDNLSDPTSIANYDIITCKANIITVTGLSLTAVAEVLVIMSACLELKRSSLQNQIQTQTVTLVAAPQYMMPQYQPVQPIPVQPEFVQYVPYVDNNPV